MGVEPSQHHPHVLAVGAEGIALPLPRRRGAGEELRADRLGGHGAVSLEMRDVTGIGTEQRPIGDDHPDLEGHGWRGAARGTEHGVDQGVRHHGRVAVTGSGGSAALGLTLQVPVELLRVESGQPCGHGRHAVLAGGHGDVPVPARTAVAKRGPFGIELPGEGRHGVPPASGAGAVHLGEPLAEDPVHLARQLRVQHGGGVGDGIGRIARHAPVGERGHDPRERLDQTPGGGEGAPGHVRGAAGDQGDVRDGGAVGLPFDPMAGRGRGALVGGAVPRLVPAVATGGVLQRGHGARLEGVECTAGGLDRAEQIGELAPAPAVGPEQGARVRGETLEEEGQVAEVVGEAGGVRPAQRGEGLLGGVLPRGAREPRCARHASMLPGRAASGQATAGDVDQQGVWRRGRQRVVGELGPPLVPPTAPRPADRPTMEA